MTRAAIQTIRIKNFRGFPKDNVPVINLSGKSLILYGENGSGKSTLFHALKDLFDPNAQFTGNIFFKEPEFLGRISLCFDKSNVPVIDAMDWQNDASHDATNLWGHPVSHQFFSNMARSAGFLDYRAILRTHFVDAKEKNINVFPLVVETLLRNIEYTTDANKQFGSEWKTLEAQIVHWNELPDQSPPLQNAEGNYDADTFARMQFDPFEWRSESEEANEDDEDDEDEASEGNPEEIDLQGRFKRFKASRLKDIEADVTYFYTELKQRLLEIQQQANKYLGDFDHWLKISFSTYELDIRNKPIKGLRQPRLLLIGEFRGQNIEHPGIFLNEARLTAIALVIYLAALKLETPLSANAAVPRLLVLDDVLIGLDMAHRLPVLGLLQTDFVNSDWQIILLTYDRAWFDVARQRLPSEKWTRYELFTRGYGEWEVPLFKEDNDHLYRAMYFIEEGEVKAAAVHVRTKFELVVKHACEVLGLKVAYSSNHNTTPCSEFWDVLRGANWTYAKGWKINKSRVPNRVKTKSPVVEFPVVPNDIEERISHSVSWVLNPLSHSQVIEHYRGEIEEAIYAVADLEDYVDFVVESKETTNPFHILTNFVAEYKAAKEQAIDATLTTTSTDLQDIVTL